MKKSTSTNFALSFAKRLIAPNKNLQRRATQIADPRKITKAKFQVPPPLPLFRINIEKKKSNFKRVKSKSSSNKPQPHGDRSIFSEEKSCFIGSISHSKHKILESSAVEEIPDFGPDFEDLHFSTPSIHSQDNEDPQESVKHLSRTSSYAKVARNKTPRFKYWDLISMSIMNSLAPKHKCIK